MTSTYEIRPSKTPITAVKSLCEGITENTLIRVYPHKMTIRHEGYEFVIQESQNDMSEYKDATHKGVQGRGYVEWRNGDFSTPFEELKVADILFLNWLTYPFEQLKSIGYQHTGVVSALKYVESNCGYDRNAGM